MTDPTPPGREGDEGAEVGRHLHAVTPAAPPDAALPARMSRAERDERALELRAAGVTFTDISAHLGCSPSAASASVARGLEAIKRAIAQDAPGLRALEVARLDAVSDALWDKAASGEDVRTTEAWLKCRESYRRLTGLDLKVDVGPAGPTFIIAAAMPTPKPSDALPFPVFEHDVVDGDVLELGAGDDEPPE